LEDGNTVADKHPYRTRHDTRSIELHGVKKKSLGNRSGFFFCFLFFIYLCSIDRGIKKMPPLSTSSDIQSLCLTKNPLKRIPALWGWRTRLTAGYLN
jgi:hypothetical protein